MTTKYGAHHKLTERLKEAGLVPKNCQRIIIDIKADDLIKIYYQCIGDDALAEIGLPEEILKTQNSKKKK